jgi:hypothetical protein
MSSLVWKRSTFLPPWFLPQALELFLIEARWPGLLRSQRPQHWFGGRRAREPLLLGSSQRQPSNNEPIDAHVKLPSATIPILPRSPCPWGHLGQRAEGCGSTLDSAFRQKQTWSACGWVSTTQARLPPPHLTRTSRPSASISLPSLSHLPTKLPLPKNLLGPFHFPISRLRGSRLLPPFNLGGAEHSSASLRPDWNIQTRTSTGIRRQHVSCPCVTPTLVALPLQPSRGALLPPHVLAHARTLVQGRGKGSLPQPLGGDQRQSSRTHGVSWLRLLVLRI